MRDEVKLIVFSITIFALSYAVSFVYPIPLPVLAILSVFFTLYTLLFNQKLLKAFNDPNKNKFTQVFMGFTSLKILLSLVMMVCFFYFYAHNHLSIGVCAMGYYMAYTVFEVLIWRNKLSS